MDQGSKGVCACAAVLPFAKRGDDRANNLVRLQQLFPRIVAGQYQPPRRASESCKDLLKRMLTPDPNLRITTDGIMQHPWCAIICIQGCSIELLRGEGLGFCIPAVYLLLWSSHPEHCFAGSWWIQLPSTSIRSCCSGRCRRKCRRPSRSRPL